VDALGQGYRLVWVVHHVPLFWQEPGISGSFDTDANLPIMS